MAEAQDLVVIFTPANGSPLLYQAVSDVQVTESVEVSAEAGVTSRTGAKLPKKFGCKIVCSDDLFNIAPVGSATADAARGKDAGQQYDTIRGLIGKDVTIDARAIGDSTSTWTIDSVQATDDNVYSNSFVVNVTATQDLSGGKGFANLGATTIKIRTITNVDGIDDVPEDTPFGAGEDECVVVNPSKTDDGDRWWKGKDGKFDFLNGVGILAETFVPNRVAAGETSSEVVFDPDLIESLGEPSQAAMMDAIAMFGRVVTRTFDPADIDQCVPTSQADRERFRVELDNATVTPFYITLAFTGTGGSTKFTREFTAMGLQFKTTFYYHIARTGLSSPTGWYLTITVKLPRAGYIQVFNGRLNPNDVVPLRNYIVRSSTTNANSSMTDSARSRPDMGIIFHTEGGFNVTPQVMPTSAALTFVFGKILN